MLWHDARRGDGALPLACHVWSQVESSLSLCWREGRRGSWLRLVLLWRRIGKVLAPGFRIELESLSGSRKHGRPYQAWKLQPHEPTDLKKDSKSGAFPLEPPDDLLNVTAQYKMTRQHITTLTNVSTYQAELLCLRIQDQPHQSCSFGSTMWELWLLVSLAKANLSWELYKEAVQSPLLQTVEASADGISDAWQRWCGTCPEARCFSSSFL